MYTCLWVVEPYRLYCLAGPVQRRLHAVQDLCGELATADCIEADRRSAFRDGVGEVLHERGRAEVTNVGCAHTLEEVHLLLSTDDVYEANVVLQAYPVEHLADVRRRRAVHERGVTLTSHRLDHAQDGERIDERGGALGRGHAIVQNQALLYWDAAVLRIHRATERGYRLAQECLRRIGR